MNSRKCIGIYIHLSIGMIPISRQVKAYLDFRRVKVCFVILGGMGYFLKSQAAIFYSNPHHPPLIDVLIREFLKSCKVCGKTRRITGNLRIFDFHGSVWKVPVWGLCRVSQSAYTETHQLLVTGENRNISIFLITFNIHHE